MADNATLEQAQFAEFVSQYVQHSLSDPDTLLDSAEPSNLTFHPDPTGPHGRWADNTLFMEQIVRIIAELGTSQLGPYANMENAPDESVCCFFMLLLFRPLTYPGHFSSHSSAGSNPNFLSTSVIPAGLLCHP